MRGQYLEDLDQWECSTLHLKNCPAGHVTSWCTGLRRDFPPRSRILTIQLLWFSSLCHQGTFRSDVCQPNPIVKVLWKNVIRTGLFLKGEKLREVSSVLPTKLKRKYWQGRLKAQSQSISWSQQVYFLLDWQYFPIFILTSSHLLGRAPVHGKTGDEVAIISSSLGPTCWTGFQADHREDQEREINSHCFVLLSHSLYEKSQVRMR